MALANPSVAFRFRSRSVRSVRSRSDEPPRCAFHIPRSSPIVAPLVRASGPCAPSRRDSLRPSPPPPRTSPARSDLVICAPLNVPTGSPRRARTPRSRPCRGVPRGAVLLRARGLPRPSGSLADPQTRLAKSRRATLAQVPRSPPGPGLGSPFPRHRTPTRPPCIYSPPCYRDGGRL